jgi:UTP--glucose-1-phosphate uridylyltransferase
MNQRKNGDFGPLRAKMQAAGLPLLFIDTFAHYYDQLVAGGSGYIAEQMIEPVYELPDAVEFGPEYVRLGEAALGETAVIKLNGGLGTSMGLTKAKSLLPVRGRQTFLEIIAQQAMAAGMPLVLMNSFNTDDDSLACLEQFPALQAQQIPRSFLQHKAPKLLAADFSPLQWPQNPDLEWCPPGHGDIYTALYTSGTLEALVAAGIKTAFVSNADNLGAVVDPAILGYMRAHDLPFLMEVADRTEMDRKGGHLARRSADGQLILRESAQCPPAEMEIFQDTGRYRYFNTNNLWFDLPALQRQMAAQGAGMRLPMIRNRKTADPRDKTSPPVYQLETAMGAAIGVIAGAAALRVPRTRFAPVKTSADLLAVQSDLYTLDSKFRVAPVGGGKDIIIELDEAYYKLVDHLQSRFPEGPPLLGACDAFIVQGDFKFGAGVVCQGRVHLENRTGGQVEIPAGATLSGSTVYE